MSNVPREFVFTRYPARQGITWLAAAYVMFKARRFAWVTLVLAYFMLAYFITLVVLRPVPYAGPYVMTVMKPVFAVGLLAAAWTQERGGTPRLRQLFQGFRANLWALLAIGVFFVAGISLAVLASSVVDNGQLLDLLAARSTLTEDQIEERLSDPMLQLGMLLSVLLSIPVVIATWWAPALVVFQDASASSALVTSLRAALANWKPLLYYSLGVFFYGGVVPIIVYVVIALVVPPSAAYLLDVVLLLPYSLFFAATLHVSDYVSYRDVFHSGETLAPLMHRT